MKIIGMLRERNESLILKDTLNHLATFVDGIIVFDDDSEDNSFSIANNHKKVLEVIRGDKWDPMKREDLEGSHRQVLLEAAQKYSPEWIFYVDADERFEGDIRNLISSLDPRVEGVKISLFDAYMTKEDLLPYSLSKGPLLNFRKYFGPEKRDILMIWRNSSKVYFPVGDYRCPKGVDNTITNFYCQHYGKAISISQYSETCEYYSNFFPKYSKKWQKRKENPIHEKSDFGNKLYVWDEVKKKPIPLKKEGNTDKLFLNKMINNFKSLILVLKRII